MVEVDAVGLGIAESGPGTFVCALIEEVLEWRLFTRSIPIDGTEFEERELVELDVIKFAAKTGGGVVCFLGTMFTGVGVSTDVLLTLGRVFIGGSTFGCIILSLALWMVSRLIQLNASFCF